MNSILTFKQLLKALLSVYYMQGIHTTPSTDK